MDKTSNVDLLFDGGIDIVYPFREDYNNKSR